MSPQQINGHAKERQWIAMCVDSGNQYMLRAPKTGKPPARIMVPFLDPNDPRMFVRNGELIKPYGITEFAFIRMESCPELDHDRACYKELVRAEFDPTGCVPIKYFDLEKLADSLNAAQEVLEQRVPDAPAI
jgi:hypothetical protein